EKYTVTSNPRKIDSDNDKLTDFEEYRNATDPNKQDSDEDGRSDYEEITLKLNSSATGIDGKPPEIYYFKSWYDVTYKKFLGVKLPNGMSTATEKSSVMVNENLPVLFKVNG
ncbi:MAG: hypothetical protein JW779_11985, partial [Candidatus Thorarchaeota archaeon]|nr:hypothetical protein [Candidatus Thorarchaeota archaeon]